MKRLLIFLAVPVFMSCNGQQLDLATIDFNQPAGPYLDHLGLSNVQEQKGHWEIAGSGEQVSLKLKDDGEKSTVYSLSEEADAKKVKYGVFMLGKPYMGKIISYHDKIAFYSFYPDKTKIFELVAELKKSLGTPTELILDTLPVNNPFATLLKKSLPATDFKVISSDDELDGVSYPRSYVWEKGDILYQFVLSAGTSSQFMAISKTALKDKIVLGYHSPDRDPVFSKYLK